MSAGDPILTVTVPGLPRPQGSMKAIMNRTTGKSFMQYKGSTVAHRNLVVGQLVELWDGRAPLSAPVAVACSFQFRRPRTHYGTGRNADALRSSAPRRWHGGMPDVDKCLRLIADALAVAGVLADDRLIALMRGEKVWAATDRTVIEVVEL